MREPPAPLLWPTAGLISGVIASSVFGALAAAPVAALLALPFMVGTVAWLARLVQRSIDWRAILFLAAAGVGAARHQLSLQPPAHHVAHLAGDEPRLARVVGVVASTPRAQPGLLRNPFLWDTPPPRMRFLLSTEQAYDDAGARPLAGLLRVDIVGDAPPQLRTGQRVELLGWLYRPRPPRNAGERDWAELARLEGVHAGLSVSEPALARTIDPASRSGAWLGWLRARARVWLVEADDVADDPARRVLESLVLGQRSAVPPEVNDAFVRTGTVHFLSVSGFHVGLLGLIVGGLLRLASGSTRVAAIGTATALVLYAAVAEPNAPILRATLMGLLACAALMLGRPASLLNALSAAALLIVAIWPQELFRAGFQLSFLQVAVLMTLGPPLYARVRRRDPLDPPADADTYAGLAARWCGSMLLATSLTALLAWIAAAPLVWAHFGMLTPWACMQTALLTPLISVTTVVGFAKSLLSAVAPPLGSWLYAPLNALANLMVWAVTGLSRIPGSSIETAAPSVGWAWICIALAGVCTFALMRLHGAARLRTFAVAGPSLLVWIVLGIVSARPGDGPGWTLHVLDVGNGSAMLLTTPSGDAAVFDVGTLENVDVGRTLATLANLARVWRVDDVCISHANLDHYSGFPTVAEKLRPARLRVNSYFRGSAAVSPLVARLLKSAEQNRTTIVADVAGEQWQCGGAAVQVLWPPPGEPLLATENDSSLVLRVSAAGRRVLLTGDIEERAIAALVQRHERGELDLHADVLVAPHHGSVTIETAALLRAVNPSIIAVSTGRDRDDFKELARAELGGELQILSTRDVGAVTLRIMPDGALTARGFNRATAPD